MMETRHWVMKSALYKLNLGVHRPTCLRERIADTPMIQNINSLIHTRNLYFYQIAIPPCRWDGALCCKAKKIYRKSVLSISVCGVMNYEEIQIHRHHINCLKSCQLLLLKISIKVLGVLAVEDILSTIIHLYGYL